VTTLKTALRDGAKFLKANGLHDAYFEARFLLLHTVGLELHHLYTYPERSLTPAETSALGHALAQRAAGRPAAYITNRREFYGLEFHIDPRVLIPRPETELVVEKALEWAATHSRELTVADIGTGSGVIAIVLATRLPSAKLYAVDISQDALDVAGLNADRLGVASRIKFLRGNLMEPLPHPANLIAANLPYVPDGDIENLPKEISSNEPRVALAGGKDGLELIRRFLKQTSGKVRPGGCIVLEIGAGQAETVLSMVDDCLPRARKELSKDFNGVNRVLKLILNQE